MAMGLSLPLFGMLRNGFDGWKPSDEPMLKLYADNKMLNRKLDLYVMKSRMDCWPVLSFVTVYETKSIQYDRHTGGRCWNQH